MSAIFEGVPEDEVSRYVSDQQWRVAADNGELGDTEAEESPES